MIVMVPCLIMYPETVILLHMVSSQVHLYQHISIYSQGSIALFYNLELDS
jgi:hypothetical protein